MYAAVMNRRMMRTIGLVMLVLGLTSLLRTLIAGRTERFVVLAIPSFFALVGFALLVLGGRLQAQK